MHVIEHQTVKTLPSFFVKIVKPEFATFEFKNHPALAPMMTNHLHWVIACKEDLTVPQEQLKLTETQESV